MHKSRRIVFGDSDEGRQWADNLLHTLKHEGAWEQLLAWRRPLRSAAKKTEADRLINYVMERCGMINYPEFAKRGWQIGSGPTESRCKTSTSRLKGRGRRCDTSNVEAIAARTTLKDNNQWNLFWITPAKAKT